MNSRRGALGRGWLGTMLSMSEGVEEGLLGMSEVGEEVQYSSSGWLVTSSRQASLSAYQLFCLPNMVRRSAIRMGGDGVDPEKGFGLGVCNHVAMTRNTEIQSLLSLRQLVEAS